MDNLFGASSNVASRRIILGMKTYLLLVTWFLTGQPPASYQTPFNSAETCATARLAVLMDAKRLAAELEAHIRSNSQGKMMELQLAASRPPTVTAVCAVQ